MAVGLAAFLVISVAACGRDEFQDRTAVVVVDGDRIELKVDSCGLDEDTLFVVGRSTRGEILQAVVGLEDDERTGDLAATGFTVDVRTDTYAAFGPASWARRSGMGSAPGSITSARLRGSRIQVTALAEVVDESGARLVGHGPAVDDVPIEIDARCDERD